MKTSIKPILTSLYADPKFSEKICQLLDVSYQPIQQHQFPDQETCITINWPCDGKNIYLLTSLEHPNPKILPLIFAVQSLKQKGAKSVNLIAPYLPYMRQDKAFHPGESISASHFARLISIFFDGLVTIDPHLHRIKNLSQIYNIPTKISHAAPAIADWINQNIENPIIIGPDSESEQWIKATAKTHDFPFIALNKIRKGDKSVEIQIKNLSKWKDKTPILVDDIISSGHTLIETCKHLKTLNFAQPVIVAIHGIFAQNAYERLTPYCKNIFTTNSIYHDSNKIDISEILSKSIINLL